MFNRKECEHGVRMGRAGGGAILHHDGWLFILSQGQQILKENEQRSRKQLEVTSLHHTTFVNQSRMYVFTTLAEEG